ncbi:MAG: hypothetical protein WCX27_03020 [Candidatus Paceibacterota bacterium]
MAKQGLVIGGSTISARQMKDFFRQADEGSITGSMFQDFLDHKGQSSKTNIYLKRIFAEEKIYIGATDGYASLANAINIFSSINFDFRELGLHNMCLPTNGRVAVEIFELVKEGTFEKIYGSFGKNRDRFCLTQSQIVRFCVEHTDFLKSDGTRNFFLFEDDNRFFVADVCRFNDKWHIDVLKLLNSNVWCVEGKPRFFFPQL